MKAVKRSAPGVVKLGPFGPYNNSVWLFHHGDEAAVAEMPPYRVKKDPKPWLSVKKYCRQEGLTLKYAFLSHIHMDHCLSLGDFRLAFPETVFVGHRTHLTSRLTWRLARSIGMRADEIFDEVYDGDIKMLDLCGEPLLLIHCPKHSDSDQFVIFRGTAMTGDWFLGDLKDCNALVHPADKIRSVERVQHWLGRLNYDISRAFSGHGDCLYYQVDFHRLLEKSKIDHDRL